MLAPVTEVHYGEEELLTLTLASRDRWAAFAAEIADAGGIDPGYRTEGTVAVARDADDLARLEEIAVFQAKLGLEVTRLRASGSSTARAGARPRGCVRGSWSPEITASTTEPWCRDCARPVFGPA